MGNRNNIKITYGGGDSVYLYSHWGGGRLRNIVENAVKTSGRVDDESYFARVLFTAMLREEDPDLAGETGLGIAPYKPDQDSNNKMVHIDYTRSTHPEIDYEYEE